MRMLYLLFLICTSSDLIACDLDKCISVEVPHIENSNDTLNTDSMKLKITVGETVLTATMYDNPTTGDFISLLPLTLTLKDFNSTEKISDLPEKLSVKDAPAGYRPLVGDITLYAPWGNLALFYKDFGYSNGLILLGKIDSGMEAFKVSGTVNVKIEVIVQNTQ